MMEISVEKYTDIKALHRANSFTTGHESHMSLARAYALGHSPIRTQRFYVYMEDIPLFAASQFVRSHVGVQWYQRTKRTDRGGENFEAVCENLADSVNTLDGSDLHATQHTDLCHEIANLPLRFDRLAPTSLMGDLNAEAIINISHKRLCATASKETREIWERVILEISEVDPDLAKFCVKPCVAHGGICRGAKCCGFNQTVIFKKQSEEYKKNFDPRKRNRE